MMIHTRRSCGFYYDGKYILQAPQCMLPTDAWKCKSLSGTQTERMFKKTLEDARLKVSEEKPSPKYDQALFRAIRGL